MNLCSVTRSRDLGAKFSENDSDGPRASFCHLGNLMTVGHLAKISPDLTLIFRHTKKNDIIFNNGKACSLTHDGAFGVETGANESYGRRTYG